MGKILFISDIHGNMPAVRALEKEIARIRPVKADRTGGSEWKR